MLAIYYESAKILFFSDNTLLPYKRPYKPNPANCGRQKSRRTHTGPNPDPAGEYPDINHPGSNRTEPTRPSPSGGKAKNLFLLQKELVKRVEEELSVSLVFEEVCRQLQDFMQVNVVL